MGGGQGTIQADGLLGTRQKAERRDPLRTRATAERGLGDLDRAALRRVVAMAWEGRWSRVRRPLEADRLLGTRQKAERRILWGLALQPSVGWDSEGYRGFRLIAKLSTSAKVVLSPAGV